MECYHDPRTCETVLRIRDREVFCDPIVIQRRVEDELLNTLVREGLRRLRQPRAIPVRSSTCFIPHKKRT